MEKIANGQWVWYSGTSYPLNGIQTIFCFWLKEIPSSRNYLLSVDHHITSASVIAQSYYGIVYMNGLLTDGLYRSRACSTIPYMAVTIN
jgi:hypothetical protein